MLLCSNLLAAQFYELWRLRVDEMHSSVKIWYTAGCYACNSSTLVTFFARIIPSGLMPLADYFAAALQTAGAKRGEEP